jgi:UDP-N-acetylmuramoyl-L-alanyl-D-glutamate--2,6-diaminopimelate ligase
VVDKNQVIYESSQLEKEIAWSQTHNRVSVLVDYAHEPVSLEKLLKLVTEWKAKGVYQQVIHVLSNDGSGRDDWKKPVMGQISQKYVDYTFFTTDNYGPQDDPQEIVKGLSREVQTTLGHYKFWQIIDRREAMRRALKLSQQLLGNGLASGSIDVLLVSTGVGSEQALTQPQGLQPWDEREEWLKLCEEFLQASKKSTKIRL